MSIGTVVTGGFGSFGTVSLVITDGFGAAAAVSFVYAKHSGAWQFATPYVKRAGTWGKPLAVYAKHNGTWQQVYP